MTSDSQNTRQQLYDRIKGSSKDSVILEEMKRLGFWKTEEGAESVPEQLINREAELNRELNNLLEKQRKYRDKEEALKEIRRERLQASRKKREENRKLRKQKREQKKTQWKEKKEKDIVYLGDEVSRGLNNKESDKEKLEKYQLPLIHNTEELSKLMGISVGQIRFLSYNRIVSRTNHYKRFYLPKKTGGKRLISTPMPRLKNAQYWILENILNKISLAEEAHGFVKNRSIVTNATPHIKAEVLINVDLKDFFPSIDYTRVKGVFRKLGYSEQLATIFALICTEPECDQVEIDGEIYHVASGERHLPQGAPTSPAVTNIICRKLDLRLRGISSKLGFTYTRYADDMTFSATGADEGNVKRLIGFVKKIVKEENFSIHPDKFRILRKGARKEVTGIVVNVKTSVNAKELDRFRALIFQIEKDGLEGKHWNNSTNLLASIKGYASFVAMVDTVKGKALKERVDKILAKHEFKHVIVHKPKPPVSSLPAKPAEEAKARKKPWWKFW
jgi:hypothetical protein